MIGIIVKGENEFHWWFFNPYNSVKPVKTRFFLLLLSRLGFFKFDFKSNADSTSTYFLNELYPRIRLF